MTSDGDDSTEDIAARLNLLREWAGFDVQSAFAEMSGIDPTEWNHYEKKRRRLSLTAAIKLRRRWGVTLDWLFEGDRSGLPLEVARGLPLLSSRREAS